MTLQGGHQEELEGGAEEVTGGPRGGMTPSACVAAPRGALWEDYKTTVAAVGEEMVEGKEGSRETS